MRNSRTGQRRSKIIVTNLADHAMLFARILEMFTVPGPALFIEPVEEEEFFDIRQEYLPVLLQRFKQPRGARFVRADEEKIWTWGWHMFVRTLPMHESSRQCPDRNQLYVELRPRGAAAFTQEDEPFTFNSTLSFSRPR